MSEEDASSSLLLRLRGVEKSFGSLQAVSHASLEVHAGSLHAVIGENGAGKSTLLRIAAGILPPDRGEIWAFGEVRRTYGAARARALGVAMVQQHFALFLELTALENLVLGNEPTRFGVMDVSRARACAEAALSSLGASLPLDQPVRTLGIGERQHLEIARALYQGARVIILDEPTAVLTPQESSRLYATLRKLAEDAEKAVVVVTHKLDEVEAHADMVTVMRRGKTLETRPVAKGEVARLAGELLGGAPLPDLDVKKGDRPLGPPELRVADLAYGRALRGVSFEVRAGEVVGVAGVLGNGQSELVAILGGLIAKDGGSVEALSLEVVHEDRHAVGLVLDATVEANLVLGALTPYTRRGLVDERRIAAYAEEQVARFDIRPSDRLALTRTLSGGNQQKIMLARALAAAPRALVLAQPTRGVDIRAARAIHEQILAARDRGVAILLVSADQDELRLLSSRILVLGRGRIVAELPPSADDQTLGAAMLGGVAHS